VGPSGTCHTILSFFKTIGFSLTSTQHHLHSPLQQRQVRQTLILTHGTSERQVTLTESFTPSNFPPLLEQNDTSLTTLAGPDGFISLYPLQTTFGIRLCNINSATSNRCEKAACFGLKSNWNTSSWTVPCGYCCPALYRRICGLQGCAYLDWPEYLETVRSMILVNLSTVDHFEWRLGVQCHNANCNLYKRGADF
jgi:hypothetical protein